MSNIVDTNLESSYTPLTSHLNSVPETISPFSKTTFETPDPNSKTADVFPNIDRCSVEPQPKL